MYIVYRQLNGITEFQSELFPIKVRILANLARQMIIKGVNDITRYLSRGECYLVLLSAHQKGITTLKFYLLL